jgi:molybdopterin molybdotransferase
MILLEQSKEIVMKEATLTGTERIEMQASPGRVLAEDVFSDMDMPPFDKSAVDGYACRTKDLKRNLSVLETIAAGSVPKAAVTPGTCSKIMTGAMVPEGADCVVMVEDTEENVAGTIRFTGEKGIANICYKGEDTRTGDKVLSAGTLIRPQEMAVLAATGFTQPLVYRQPRVSVITTGDELVRPSVKPRGAAIRDSNSCQLEAQVNRAGAIATNLGIVADNEHTIREVIGDAFSASDIVLLTGGVSMGDFDHVPRILKSMGFEIMFRTIAIQPGKPTVFARAGKKLVFALPGNPVSSFVLFEILVRPFIMKMMGWTGSMPVYRMVLGEDILRRKSGRHALIPVTIRNGEVFPVEYHGSAHINAYTAADGIISMEIGTNELKKGTFTDVRPV